MDFGPELAGPTLLKEWDPLNYVIFPGCAPTYEDSPLLTWLPDGASSRFPCRMFAWPRARYTVVVFHGNTGDIGRSFVFASQLAQNVGVNVFLVEYPGYGLAPRGMCTEAGCVEHGRIALTYLTMVLGIQPCNMILMGRSLGSGVAMQLASEVNVRAVILQSPYKSIRDVAVHLVGWPGWLVLNRFDNARLMPDLACPLLIVHGANDQLIPATHAQQLFDLCRHEHKTLHLVEGADHVCIAPTRVLELVAQFVSQLRA